MNAISARKLARVAHDPIPVVVKRNTLLLAVTQACVGIGNQMVPTLGAITTVQLTGALALSGLATSLLGGSRLAVAYPVGMIMDRYGRRAGLLLGLVLCLIGGLIVGLATLHGAAVAYFLGIAVLGCGISAIQQLRLAAADMYPPDRRGEGMGYVLTGSLAGAFIAPGIISVGNGLAPELRVDPLAAAWLLIPLVTLPCFALVALIRPDPRDIATNLHRYYPHYQPPAWHARRADMATGLRVFIRHYPKQAAFVSSFAAQGNMTMMMAMTSLALAHHGHELPAISLAVAIHVMGMFGFSLPLGKLADVAGRRNVMLLGLAGALGGALLIALFGEYWIVTAGTFLVGLGWSAVHVGAASLIADTTAPAERGRAIGTNDALSSAGSMLLPVIGGLLVAAAGLPALAYVSLSLMVLPTVMLLRLSEPTPGKYAERPI
jgi:MFS family permease